MELLALYSCNLSWNIKLRGIPKQTKAKGPQADLDTGQRLTTLAITLIFPPTCDHAFWRRASGPDKYMSMVLPLNSLQGRKDELPNLTKFVASSEEIREWRMGFSRKRPRIKAKFRIIHALKVYISFTTVLKILVACNLFWLPPKWTIYTSIYTHAI